MMSQEPAICPHCQAPAAERFCAVCGADLLPPVPTGKDFWKGLPRELFHIKNRFRETTVRMFRQPGEVVRSWLQKKDKEVMQPLRFLIIWAGANVLIARLLKVGHGEPSGSDAVSLQIDGWISEYFAVMWVMLVPAMALAPFLLFRRSFPHYLSHMSLVAYWTGINCLLSIPTIVLEGIWPGFAPYRSWIGPAIPILYGFWLFRSFFRRPWYLILPAVLLAEIFGILFLLVLIQILYYALGLFGVGV